MDTTTQNTTGSAATGPAPDASGEPTTHVADGPQLPAGDSVSQGPASPGVGERLASYRLRRSTTDKMLGGVCGGLARDLGVDAALLRVLVLVLTLVTGGAAALVYLAAWVVAPAD